MPEAKKSEPKKIAMKTQKDPKSSALKSTKPKAGETLQSDPPKQNSQISRIGSRREKLRESLTRNKIFFETLAATTLTGMAFIVAIAQLVIMNKQTIYLEQQNVIERAQALPMFVVETDQVWNEDKTFKDTEKLVVYNYGNSAYNVHVNNVVFLDASYALNGETQKRRIPISGYFTFTEITNSPTGLISSSSATGNGLAFYNLQKELYGPVGTKYPGLLLIELKMYVSITYFDIFNVLHTDYYQVESVFPGEKMEELDGATIFEEYYKEERRDIYELTLEEIYNYFK